MICSAVARFYTAHAAGAGEALVSEEGEMQSLRPGKRGSRSRPEKKTLAPASNPPPSRLGLARTRFAARCLLGFGARWRGLPTADPCSPLITQAISPHSEIPRKITTIAFENFLPVPQICWLNPEGMRCVPGGRCAVNLVFDWPKPPDHPQTSGDDKT